MVRCRWPRRGLPRRRGPAGAGRARRLWPWRATSSRRDGPSASSTRARRAWQAQSRGCADRRPCAGLAQAGPRRWRGRTPPRRGRGREHGRRAGARPARRHAGRPRARPAADRAGSAAAPARRSRSSSNASISAPLAAFSVTSPHTIHPDAGDTLAAFARASRSLGSLAQLLERPVAHEGPPTESTLTRLRATPAWWPRPPAARRGHRTCSPPGGSERSASTATRPGAKEPLAGVEGYGLEVQLYDSLGASLLLRHPDARRGGSPGRYNPAACWAGPARRWGLAELATSTRCHRAASRVGRAAVRALKRGRPRNGWSWDMRRGLAGSAPSRSRRARPAWRSGGDLIVESARIDQQFAGGGGTLAARLRGGSPPTRAIGASPPSTRRCPPRLARRSLLRIAAGAATPWLISEGRRASPAIPLGSPAGWIYGWVAKRLAATVARCTRFPDPAPCRSWPSR